MGIDVGGITLAAPGGNTFSVSNGATPWMNVSSNGILTRPQSPFMRGTLKGMGSYYNAGGGPLLLTADVNRGSCWNNATGLFTASVAGYYLATAGNIVGANSGYLQLRKNNVTQHFTHWSHSTNWNYLVLSGIASLAVGDYLSWHLASYNPSTAGVYGGGDHAMYSFALMA